MIRFQRQRDCSAVRFLSLAIMLQVILFQCVPGFVLGAAADEEETPVSVEIVSTDDQEPTAIAVDAAEAEGEAVPAAAGADEGKAADGGGDANAGEVEEAEGEEEVEYDYTPRGMPLPPAEVTVAGRFGDSEFETYGGVLVPLYYGEDFGLLYINPRYSITDFDEEELNFGLGWRNIFEVNDYDFILGANVFYDSRWTQFNNQFDQLGVGAEFLSKWVDARYNHYLPDDDHKKAREFETEEVRTSTSVRSGSSTTLSTSTGPITASGNTVTQAATTTARTTTRTTRTTTVTTSRFLFEQFEAALEGFDAEIGVLLPIIDTYMPTRIFIGYQDFKNPFGKNFDGLKGRLEAQVLPGLTLDVELFENEELNGTDYYIGARAHVPLDLQNLANGRNPFEGTKERFQPSGEEQALAKRLTQNVIRDPRVLTNLSELRENVAARTVSSRSSSSSSSSTSERVVDQATYVLFRGIFVNNANTSGREDGTIENPWNTIQEGVDATGPAFDNNVYTFKGTGPYRENVVVAKNNVNLRSEAKPIFGIDGSRFGGTGMRPVVDGNVAGVNGPALRISGRNVTVDAYEFTHSPGGTNPGLRDITGRHVIDGAGIVAENANGLNLIDVKSTGNTYGALLVHDASQPGAPANFNQTIRGLEAPGNSVANLAVDALGAGGTMNLAVMGANLSAGGNGLQISAEDFDAVTVSLDDIVASGNAGYGIFTDLDDINGPILVELMDVIATDNAAEGVHIDAESDGGPVTVNMAGVTADRNGLANQHFTSDGIDVDLESDVSTATFNGMDLSASNNNADGIRLNLEGELGVVGNLSNVTANENEDDGIHADLDSTGGLFTPGSDVTFALNGATLDGNGDDGLEINSNGGGTAEVELSLVDARGNGEDGIDATVNADGDVMLSLTQLRGNNNNAEGLEFNANSRQGRVDVTGSALAASYNGDAGLRLNLVGEEGIAVSLDNVKALGNEDDGILANLDSTGGLFTPGGDVTFALNRATVDGNGDDGLEINSNGGGTAEVELSLVDARGNGEDGIDATVNADGDVMLSLTQLRGNNNNAEGLEFNANSRQGRVDVTGSALAASYNDDDGIRLSLVGEEGIATSLGNLKALGNEDNGINVFLDSTGGLFTPGSDIRLGIDGATANENGDDGIHVRSFGGGTADIVLNRAAANDNDDDGTDMEVYADGDLAATLSESTGNRNRGDGIELRARSNQGNVVITEVDLSASDNGDDDIIITGSAPNGVVIRQ